MNDTIHGYSVIRSERHTGLWSRPGRMILVDRGQNLHPRYVTAWHFDGDDEWWLGHYFRRLDEANASFNSRLGRKEARW